MISPMKINGRIIWLYLSHVACNGVDKKCIKMYLHFKTLSYGTRDMPSLFCELITDAIFVTKKQKKTYYICTGVMYY